MVTTVQKWGNSQGLRLPKELLGEAHISVGDEVNVVMREGAIIITPMRRTRGRYNLDDLLSDIPEDYVPEEVDWGRPVGKEEW